MELPRPVDTSDSALTYDPERRLLVARAAVEICRILPMLFTVWLALATVRVLTRDF